MTSVPYFDAVWTAARAGSRTWKEMQDVARAGETMEALKQQLADFEAEFTAEVQALESAASPATEVLDRVSVKLKKTNIAVRLIALWTSNATCPSSSSGMIAIPDFTKNLTSATVSLLVVFIATYGLVS